LILFQGAVKFHVVLASVGDGGSDVDVFGLSEQFYLDEQFATILWRGKRGETAFSDFGNAELLVCGELTAFQYHLDVAHAGADRLMGKVTAVDIAVIPQSHVAGGQKLCGILRLPHVELLNIVIISFHNGMRD
jgi:hypothetical protein